MEKPLFPSNYMRITQGYNEGTHKNSFAIDNAGKDSGIGAIYAPYTGIIKKIYTTDANEVWLESVDKVEYADGTQDYLTILFAHANNVDNLFVGRKIKKGEVFYSEGTKGNTSGNHCHLECGRGKFSNSGWHKNNSGYWSIDNGIKPESCLWIDDSIKILDDYSYNFKKIPTVSVEKPKVAESETPKVEQSTTTKEEPKEEQKEKLKDEPLVTNDFTFTAPKTDLYGVYLKENQEIIIKEST